MEKHPERFYRVTETQLSIARYYGGITFNGKYYVYDPVADTLTREDVLRREQQAAREQKRAAKKARAAGGGEQGRMFENGPGQKEEAGW